MLSNATRFRRTIAGLCLIIAPLFLLISDLLETRRPTQNIQELLDTIAANQVANEIAFAFAIYGFALMIPAVVGILHLLRVRSVALGHIAGIFVIIGLVSFAFVGGTEFLLFGAGADPTLNRDMVVELNERIGSSIVYNLINLTEIFGFIFGFALFGVALFRAQVIPRLFAVLLSVGILLRLFLASFYVGVIVSDLLYSTALIYIGSVILRQSDNEWERTSEHVFLPKNT